jgi:hypothetical protein
MPGQALLRRLKVPWKSPLQSVEDRHVRVLLADNIDAVDRWIETHIFHSGSESSGLNQYVGFDMEWTPSFQKGAYNKTDLVQLATSTDVLLVRCNRLPTFPRKLESLIQSETVVKTGVGVFEDLQRICQDFQFPLLSGSFQDLGLAAARLPLDSVERPVRFSLDGISQHIFRTPVKGDGKRLQMSHWGAR